MIQRKGDLLKISNLKIEFPLKHDRVIRAVDGIDLNIKEGEIHGIVGESGCGKTVTSLSITNLIRRPGLISGGKIIWHDQDLLKLRKNEIRKVRGKEIAMIFQNPELALNPLYSIGDQMRAVIKLHHRSISRKDAQEEVFRLLHLVRISDPEKRINDYPHQLSGGMCQRVLIAMAISCKPCLLVADEPTASLDVTIQAQILDLLLELRERFQMAILLISHDMGVVARMCDTISVMYLGRIVEVADAHRLYASPKHPYTEVLLKSVPVPDPNLKPKITLTKGDPPSSIDIPSGCRFRTRCPKAFDRCKMEDPLLKEVDQYGTQAACWLY